MDCPKCGCNSESYLEETKKRTAFESTRGEFLQSLRKKREIRMTILGSVGGVLVTFLLVLALKLSDSKLEIVESLIRLFSLSEFYSCLFFLAFVGATVGQAVAQDTISKKEKALWKNFEYKDTKTV